MSERFAGSTSIPLHTVSESNTRGHWGGRHRRAQNQRGITKLAMRRAAPKLLVSVVVTLTRVAPRELDKHDNLRAALKGCVDGVADAFGLANDRDPRVEWRYAQKRPPKPRQYGVVIAYEGWCDDDRLRAARKMKSALLTTMEQGAHSMDRRADALLRGSR